MLSLAAFKAAFTRRMKRADLKDLIGLNLETSHASSSK
jgi:hypothetical protein